MFEAKIIDKRSYRLEHLTNRKVEEVRCGTFVSDLTRRVQKMRNSKGKSEMEKTHRYAILSSVGNAEIRMMTIFVSSAKYVSMILFPLLPADFSSRQHAPSIVNGESLSMTALIDIKTGFQHRHKRLSSHM